MNTLAFVLSFLLLFAILSSSFSPNTDIVHYKKGLEGLISATKELRNHIEGEKFKKIPSIKKSPTKKRTPSPPKERQEIPYVNPREYLPPLEKTRLNIYPLFLQGRASQKEHLSKTLLRLLSALYGHLFNEGDLWQLIEEIKKQGAKINAPLSQKAITFSSLYPEHEPMRSLLYTLLKGTSHYDTTQKKGIPPLTDFVILDPYQKRKPLCFRFASPIVMESFFGRALYRELLHEEKKVHEKKQGRSLTTLKKGELTQFLEERNKSFLLEGLQFYAPMRKKEKLSIEDPKTKIKVSKESTLFLPKPKEITD